MMGSTFFRHGHPSVPASRPFECSWTVLVGGGGQPPPPNQVLDGETMVRLNCHPIRNSLTRATSDVEAGRPFGTRGAASRHAVKFL